MPKDLDVVDLVTGQPQLFSSSDLCPEVLKGAREFIHSGVTTFRDAQSAARIIAAASLGWSERRIARELGHGRDTVHAVLRLAEQAGKVRPVKERVLAAAAAALHSDIELGNEEAERVRNGEGDLAGLAALRRSTWVGAGILADKGAADRPAVVVNVASGSAVQVVQEYASRLARLTGASDSASVVNTTQAIDVQAVADCDAATDAVMAAPARHPEPAPDSGPAAQGGGGGSVLVGVQK